ncbi:Mediator of RNA polymerase II transcription subunit 31 [Mizuhopecten yessoensis]|uniref:Mediator of RNA polymerase II transcription subunit 31 n=1 Tax=Mizuhopecten yessoensis TaxID=6573 RepID=A0A210QLP0_MIZYE|nr:Mediator of RNA polymerase II transcription subunit 31 [Mizuhopecten yessoensis]
MQYPQCLHFLELLQYAYFWRELVNTQCAKFIDDQQFFTLATLPEEEYESAAGRTGTAAGLTTDITDNARPNTTQGQV